MGETTSPSVSIQSSGMSWGVDGPLKDVISAFNGGSPVNLVNGVKSLIANGFTLTGTADFLGNMQASMTATIMDNGDITLLAQLAEIQLSHLLAAAPAIKMVPGFEVPMPNVSVLINRTGSDISLSAAATIANVGELVVKAQHSGDWQVAVGFQVNAGNLASLPGLKGSKLAGFDDIIGLSDVMMVISSHDDADFDFPELSSFQAPALGSGKITLPKQAAGKLVEGLNVYAGLDTTRGKAFRAIARFLNLQLNGTVGVTLAVSLPDPETNSKLFFTVQEQIKPGITLSGELGALMAGGDAAVFMTGEVVAPIQGQPATFDVTALVVETGVLFSGSMVNTAPIHFDVADVRFALANVGLVAGIDDEGIPSLGFCATLDVDRFNAAVAVFVDSVTPSNSMFAAAISELTLLDVVEVLAKQRDLPPALHAAFDAFGLKPLQAFTLPISVARALDQRDYGAVAAAFASHQVKIPAGSDELLLDVNTAGQLWYLTDLKSMNHYKLTVANGAVAVALEPQLYAAPQATSIGANNFPQGYKLIGEVDLLVARATIDIDIKGPTGIVADVYIDPITVVNPNFLAITGAGGVGGPYVSLATFAQPQEMNPQFRQPHFAMSGELRLLGAEVANVMMNFSKSGIIFDVQGYVTPVVQVDLHATLQDLHNLSFGGSIVVGVNNSFNLGPLGSVQVVADASGSLNVALANGTASARFQAGLQFQSWSLQTPVLSLDVTSGALLHLADTLVAELQQVLVQGLRQDVNRFLDWVKRGVLTGLHSVEQVASVLHTEFNLGAQDTARLLQGIGHNATEIASALKSAFGMGTGDVAKVLNGLGHSAGDIAGALRSAFNLSAKDAAGVLKDSLGLASDAVNTALKAAGYAAGDIKNALSSAFDWAKTHLNPLHW